LEDQSLRVTAWLLLLELNLDSTLKLLEVVDDNVEIGEGVSFFLSPFKICCPFADIVIYLFELLFFDFS